MLYHPPTFVILWPVIHYELHKISKQPLLFAFHVILLQAVLLFSPCMLFGYFKVVLLPMNVPQTWERTGHSPPRPRCSCPTTCNNLTLPSYCVVASFFHLCPQPQSQITTSLSLQ
jgi:hypothetical protein